MIITDYSWPALRTWLTEIGEPLDGVPEDGCVKELRALFKKRRGLKRRLIADIRNASGDVACAICSARCAGWWPKSTAVADIRNASGDVACAIYRARRDGWWPD